MASVDYTTVILKEGVPVDFLKIGAYKLDAYKGQLFLTDSRKNNERTIYIEDLIPFPDSIPELTDIHKIHLISKDDIAKLKRTVASVYANDLRNYEMVSKATHKPVSMKRVFCKYSYLMKFFEDDELDLYICTIANSTIIYFPASPAFGGASYAYVIMDDNTLCMIASGYGHYMNPTLHWINRGLSKEVEEAILKAFWDEMSYTKNFAQLLIGQSFDHKIHYRDGSALYGTDKDTITDPAIIRLYSILKEREHALRGY